MNKKLLSALLLGALTVTSTGTLVSCKDYDDDIAHLQDQIDANNETLKQIEALIKSGSVITSVEQNGEGVKFTLSNGQSYTVKNGTNGIAGAAGKDADVWTIGADGYWYKNNEKSEYKAVGDKGDKGDQGDKGDKGDQGDKGDKGDKGETGAPGAGVDGKYYVPNEKTGCFDIYQNGKFVEATTIKYTAQGALTAVAKDGKVTLTGLVDKDGNAAAPYVIAMGGELTGLVYNPTEYYQGIEAICLEAIQYKPITLFAANINKDQTDGAAANKDVTAAKDYSFVPEVKMAYYLNPKNALIETVKEDMTDEQKADVLAKYGFVVNDAQYTRSFAGSDLTVTNVTRSTENGLINVTAKIKNDLDIKSIAADQAVTVTALRYNGSTVNGDENAIISDFAALHRQASKDFTIVYKRGLMPVNETAKEAKDDIAIFDVALNETLNLSQYITVTYNPNEEGDQEMTADKLASVGFKLQYEGIGYFAGANNTNETIHANITEDGKVTPDGQPGSIGRTPMVRVKLVDTNNNQVVAVGYIKINITAKAVKPIESTITPFEKGYNLVCGTSNYNTFKMTWNQMEDIFNQTGLSRAQFDARYELDVVSATSGVAKQFDAQHNELAADKCFGSVKATTSDPSDHQTNVLTWTIGNNEAYNFAAANNAGATKSIIVRFVSKNADEAIAPVYVTLGWKLTSATIKPAAALTKDQKAVSAWDNTFTYIRAHVNEPGNGATCVFNVNVKNAFSVDPLTFVKDAIKGQYASLANTLTGKYVFVTPTYAKAGSATNGKADYYTLSVSADGTTLNATHGNVKTPIATIAADGQVTYNDNSVAKDVLNYANHKQLAAGQTLTAKVKFVVTACAPAEDAVKVSGNEFDVKVLRPVNVENGTAKEITDGTSSVITSNVTFTFSDWRDIMFNANTANTALYDFYEVENIVKNPSKDIETTWATGSYQKNDASKFDIKYNTATRADMKNGKFGTITYTKTNGISVTKAFKVKVPVVVTYKWGTIYTDLIMNVKPTVAND